MFAMSPLTSSSLICEPTPSASAWRQAYMRHRYEKSLLKIMVLSRAQGSVYISQDEDLANLLQAMNALKALPWFPRVVRDIRAFRVEQWSEFTPFMQQS